MIGLPVFRDGPNPQLSSRRCHRRRGRSGRHRKPGIPRPDGRSLGPKSADPAVLLRGPSGHTVPLGFGAAPVTAAGPLASRRTARISRRAMAPVRASGAAMTVFQGVAFLQGRIRACAAHLAPEAWQFRVSPRPINCDTCQVMICRSQAQQLREHRGIACDVAGDRSRPTPL